MAAYPRPKNAARQLQKEIGDHAESVVNTYHQYAENQRRAVLWKIPTPTRHLGDRIVYEKKSIVDYLGVLCANGRHIAEEVKSCWGASLDLAVVSPEQRAYLDKVWKAGAIALVTVVDQKNVVYTLPWADIRGFVRVPREVWMPHRVGVDTYLVRFLP